MRDHERVILFCSLWLNHDFVVRDNTNTVDHRVN